MNQTQILHSTLARVAVTNPFGISFDTFKILGGVILTFIGFNMFGEKKNTNTKGSLNDLIMFAASPGTIAMTITLASNDAEEIISFNLLIGLTIAVGITIGVMIFGCSIKKSSGGNSYATKFMGLIVAVMGLQFILDGNKNFFLFP